MMVLMRWAMVMVVQSANSLLMVSWMRSSVSRSTAAVASSSTSTRVFLRSALARHTSCRCPMERFSPPSATACCRRRSSPDTYDFRWAFSSACHTLQEAAGDEREIVETYNRFGNTRDINKERNDPRYCIYISIIDQATLVLPPSPLCAPVVVVLVAGVEVHPEGAGEQHRVLRDDGDARSQVVQPQGRDVQPVDHDAALRGLHDAEQRQRQRGLS